MPGGRPSKRTPEASVIICRAVRLGFDLKSAAQVAGMSYSTLADWRAQDAEFSEALEKAQGEGKMTYGALLLRDAKSGKTAATIFWLKTRTEEFREHKPEDALDGAVLAEQFHQKLRELEGVVPEAPAE
jgi:hypothetical protein